MIIEKVLQPVEKAHRLLLRDLVVGHIERVLGPQGLKESVDGADSVDGRGGLCGDGEDGGGGPAEELKVRAEIHLDLCWRWCFSFWVLFGLE
ncbi:hypothetical protein IMZ48_06635 [Candidatus Bathyarchaeota archaeon]|nr:hypothetical protein [Candidatus Bathyarchaeota archaeon]